MARRRMSRWAKMFVTVLGLVTVAIGVIALARWELNRTCVRWLSGSGHRVCAEYR